jgi:hypothetical protein
MAHLLFDCLEHALETAGADRSIAITVASGSAGPEVTFSGLADLDGTGAAFPGDRESRLMTLLGADVTPDAGSGTITVAIHR